MTGPVTELEFADGTRVLVDADDGEHDGEEGFVEGWHYGFGSNRRLFHVRFDNGISVNYLAEDLEAVE